MESKDSGPRAVVRAAQIRCPAMVVRRMKPTQNNTTTVMPMTAMTTPKTMPRAATMAGRMALSLTVAS